MYRFLALGAHSKLSEITKKLSKTDVDFKISKLTDLEILISNDDTSVELNGQDILDFDYVWLTSSWGARPIAYAVSLYLEKQNIDFSPVEEEKSKLVDMFLFASKGINLPDTYFTSTKNLKNRLSQIVEFCSYPFIIKSTRGSLGGNIFLVSKEKEFYNVLKNLNPKDNYICQRFIPNTFDYRIIIAHGEIVSAVKRVRQEDSFRNNTYLGAEEFFMNVDDVPSQVVQIAIESTEALNLNWSGVDIVTCTETGKSYILELNRRPGFTSDSSEISAAYNHVLSIVA